MKEGIVDILDGFFDARLKAVHTSLPGKIVSYSGHTTRKAVVKLSIKFRMLNGDILDIPPIDNVPVIFPGSKKFQLLFPLEKDDGCMVLFSEEGIGSFLKGAVDMPGDSLARFSLTDAIAIPGLWSFPTVPTNPTDYIEITSDGKVKISSGSTYAARKDDAVKSTSTEDPTAWAWLSGFIGVFQSWTPVPNDGGLVLKTALTAFLGTNPVPTSLTGKITGGSSKVTIG